MKDLFSLKGKTALITGASRGLGKAMAVALADAGAFVVCSSSKPGGAEDTVRRIQDAGGQAVGIAADLSDRTSVDRLFETAMQQTGRIDILVNNGGTIARYPAADFPMEAWDRVLEVNLTASFRLAQLAARGGHRDAVARRRLRGSRGLHGGRRKAREGTDRLHGPGLRVDHLRRSHRRRLPPCVPVPGRLALQRP